MAPWRDGADAEQLAAHSSEMADVSIYLVHLADALGVDLLIATSAKIETNESRFPVSG